MKHLSPSLRGAWKNIVLAMLYVALGFGSVLKAQTTNHSERSESLIKNLQEDPNTRKAVTAADKALLEQALGNPKFAERLASHRGPIYVMMHGLEFEPIQGMSIAGKPVTLLDKGELLAKNPGTFFILQDIQRTSDAAFVELVLHYNFDGSYKHSIGAETLMERVNGKWTNKDLTTKTIR